MTPNYIIVQAGGKGTRMDYLTKNKPKALVPVGNRPMLFQLFEKFPDKNFLIIADYKSDVLRNYLSAFATVNYLLVEVHGKTGTCSGIAEALEYIPASEPFALIWSDLVLPQDFRLEGEGNSIGLSQGFQCRWKYEDNAFKEEPSKDFGVAGLFLFEDKACLQDVPQEGEFVRWLQEKKLHFNPILLCRTREYGLIQEWEKDNLPDMERKCRPFNRIDVEGNIVTKVGVDEQGKALAKREKEWYQYANRFGFEAIPQIFSYEPFSMQRIQGRNVFEYDFNVSQKKVLLEKMIKMLRKLHSYQTVKTDYFSIYEAYFKKTFQRLDKVRNLIPFAEEKYITINGKRKHNVFFFRDELEKRIMQYRCDNFTFIHGDNTFSNIMLDEELNPVLIDPRGYFGHTELYGDPAYDWAKLYYSIRGNYDQFNRKHFRLTIGEHEVELKIASNGWEELASYYCDMISSEVSEETLKLLHAVIWLSLTTYAWEDYDSICGAYYNGICYLEETLWGGGR